MKKAIFASIVMLASLTACQNESTDNGSMLNVESNARQTSRSASPIETEEIIKAIESDFNGNPDPTSRYRVLCSINFPRPYTGHACVQSTSGTIYGVDWNDGSYPLPKYDEPYYTTIGPRHYVVYEQSSCNCN